jgi:predicted nuclease of predicted toxin-antitoxin system
MKFLCDVHISYKLVNSLNSSGYEAIHVNQLPDKWHTSDSYICNFADTHDFVVITKDSDFRNNFFIKRSPKKLIKINLGNVSNKLLLTIFDDNLHKINKFQNSDSFLLEIDKTGLRITNL